jgi:hypothetical protein
MKRIFMEGACDRFILNVVETECFFNFDGRLPRSGGGLYRRKRRKLAYDRLLLFKHPEMQFPSIKILFDYYFSFSIAVRLEVVAQPMGARRQATHKNSDTPPPCFQYFRA